MRAWCRARLPDTPLDAKGAEVVTAYAAAMDALDLRRGAELMGELVTAANLFIVQTAPWALAKNGDEQHSTLALGALARCLARLAVLSGPFMPGKSAELWSLLGADRGRAIDGVGNSHGPCGRRLGGQKARGPLSQAPIWPRECRNDLSRCVTTR